MAEIATWRGIANMKYMQDRNPSNDRHLLLALHSCSNTLGVATLDTREPKKTLKSSTFPIGKYLSNKIISCVDEVLPASLWSQITRLSVAIGPGGFTGTRVTVAMARTLSQQLNCNLDGISNFALMAPRLANELKPQEKFNPFWIIQDLPRRGTVAGKYLLKQNSNALAIREVLELEIPHLLHNTEIDSPALEVNNNVSLDIIQLIKLSLIAHINNNQSHWENILPIYPTSPVQESK